MRKYVNVLMVSFLVGTACMFLYVGVFRGGSHQDLVHVIMAPTWHGNSIPMSSPYYARAIAAKDASFDVYREYRSAVDRSGLETRIMQAEPRAAKLAMQLDLMDAVFPFLICIPLLTVALVWTRERVTGEQQHQLGPKSFTSLILAISRKRVSRYIVVPAVATALFEFSLMELYLAGFESEGPIPDYLIGVFVFGLACVAIFVYSLVGRVASDSQRWLLKMLHGSSHSS
jgi:hypothetical protein